MSTVCQPSSNSYFVPPVDKPWGLVSLDWSVASDIWKKPNQSESTVEATSIRGCQMIKQLFPDSRCFIYHNMELALQAFETQRRVMYDPALADYFLQYTDGAGHKNGTIYNEPGGPGDQFFWDYRVEDAADYYLSSVLSTLDDPAVDGTFTDDVTGFPEEHDGGPANIDMPQAEVDQVKFYTGVASQRLIDQLIAKGKYGWQAFGAQDGVGQGVSKDQCSAFMTQRCGPEWQKRAITMQHDSGNKVQSVAAFLISRPPTAFLGFGWYTAAHRRAAASLRLPLLLLTVSPPAAACCCCG